MVSVIHRHRNVGEIVTEQPEDIAIALGHLSISSPVSIRGGSAARRIQPGDEPPVGVSEPRALFVYQTVQPNAPKEANAPLSIAQINENIAAIMSKNITPHARSPMGWIYAFRGRQFPAAECNDLLLTPIKIGHTGKNDVADRIHTIGQRCKFRPEKLFHYAVPDSLKYESLVHATLHQHRRWEALGCIGCNKKHIEWFAVEGERARRVVRMWAFFAALDPYDEGGALREEWRTRLRRVDYRDPWCWETFVYGAFVDRFVDEAYRSRMRQRASVMPGVVEG
ncbi:hypothetical protein GE09DRAFT_1142362 [Coniochaeta sp. 2T2.1]|nr:hypothetical protein GE09DRAFT_1142362 [Coniochaeta sp. 2T2.1]